MKNILNVLKKNKNILAIIGESAAGKDTFVQCLIDFVNSNDFELEAQKVVSYTTRPIRSNETEGIDYYFISDEKFDSIRNTSGFYEETCYRVDETRDWRYALGADCFNWDMLNIVIVNPHGLEQLAVSEVGPQIIPIYINCSESERIKRYFERDAYANEEVLAKRIRQDNHDFKYMNNLLKKFPSYIKCSNENRTIKDVVLEVLNQLKEVKE